MTHPSGIYRYRGRHSFGKVSGTPRFILPVSLRSWGLTLYVSSLFVLLTDIPVADGKPPAVQRFATQPSDQTQVLGSMAVFPCRVINQTGVVQWTRDGFGLGIIRRLSGFDRYSMVGSDEEGDFSLSISPITLEDDAEYQCQVSSPTGKPLRSRVAKLTVMVPPDPPVIKPEPTVYATAGDAVSLTCYSSGGRPAPEIQWLDGSGSVIHDGVSTTEELMEDGKRIYAESKVTFTPTRLHHKRTMSCVTHNPALPTPLTATVQLEVKYPPELKLSLTPNELHEGNEALVSCNEDANPSQVTYKWFRGGQQVEVANDVASISLGILTRGDHGTLIACEATNSVGTTRQTMQLNVNYAPKFVSAPNSESAEPDQEVTLKCRVDANPKPSIVWTYLPTGKMVGMGEEFKVKATPGTKGPYTCTATSQGFPPLASTIHLRLRGPPKITGAGPVWVSEGQKAVLRCTVRAVPHPVSMSWLKGGVTLTSEGDKYTIEEKQLADGVVSSLIINSTYRDDFSTYNCTVINEYGMDIKQILLQRKPSFSLMVVFGIGACALFIIIFVIFFLLCCRRGRPKKDMKEVKIEETYVKPTDTTVHTENHTGPVVVSSLPPKLLHLDTRSTGKDSDTKDGDMRTASSMSVGDRDSEAAWESDREPSPRLFPQLQLHQSQPHPPQIQKPMHQPPITVPHRRFSSTSFIGPDQSYLQYSEYPREYSPSPNNNNANNYSQYVIRSSPSSDPPNSLPSSLAPPPYTPPPYSQHIYSSQPPTSQSSTTQVSSPLRAQITAKANGKTLPPSTSNGRLSNGGLGLSANGALKNDLLADIKMHDVPGDLFESNGSTAVKSLVSSPTNHSHTKYILPPQAAMKPGTLV